MFANLYVITKREASLKKAVSAGNDAIAQHQNKQLLLERSVFLCGYESWRKNSLSRVLVLIKLEGLSQVNRMVGHDFGDLLIAKLGKRINAELVDSDVLTLPLFGEEVSLCYLGGVDFAFAVDTNSESHLHQKLVHRISDLVKRPTHVENIDSELSLRVAIVEDKQAIEPTAIIGSGIFVY